MKSTWDQEIAWEWKLVSILISLRYVSNGALGWAQKMVPWSMIPENEVKTCGVFGIELTFWHSFPGWCFLIVYMPVRRFCIICLADDSVCSPICQMTGFEERMAVLNNTDERISKLKAYTADLQVTRLPEVMSTTPVTCCPPLLAVL